jgi:hypothetical protein
MAGSLDANSTIPTLISLGIDNVIHHWADNIYAFSNANTTSPGSTMSSLIISSNDQFINNPFVTAMKDFNAFWYAVLYLLFVLIGAALVWKNNNNPLPSLTNGFSYGEYMNSDKYIKTVIWGLIIFAFVYFGLDYIFKLEYLISQGIASETFDIIPPTDATNSIAYLLGAIIYMQMQAFFLFRYFVVGITTAFILFLFGLFLFPYLRGIIKTVLSYALLMLFSRVILAFTMAAGIALITALPFDLGKVTILPFLVLELLMDIIALVIVLGPFTVMKWAKTGLKIVTVAM